MLRDLFTQALKSTSEVEDGEYDWMKLNGGKGWDYVIIENPTCMDMAIRTPLAIANRLTPMPWPLPPQLMPLPTTTSNSVLTTRCPLMLLWSGASLSDLDSSSPSSSQPLIVHLTLTTMVQMVLHLLATTFLAAEWEKRLPKAVNTSPRTTNSRRPLRSNSRSSSLPLPSTSCKILVIRTRPTTPITRSSNSSSNRLRLSTRVSGLNSLRSAAVR